METWRCHLGSMLQLPSPMPLTAPDVDVQHIFGSLAFLAVPDSGRGGAGHAGGASPRHLAPLVQEQKAESAAQMEGPSP